MGGRFDLRARQHELKLVRESADRARYENRDGVACPACDRPFERVLASERRAERVSPDPGAEFCVVRESDRVLVFTRR